MGAPEICASCGVENMNSHCYVCFDELKARAEKLEWAYGELLGTVRDHCGGCRKDSELEAIADRIEKTLNPMEECIVTAVLDHLGSRGDLSLDHAFDNAESSDPDLRSLKADLARVVKGVLEEK